MNLNSKTIISTALILLCGICADGHAKSKKKTKNKNKNKHTEAQVTVQPSKPKIETPITEVQAKEVVVESPKVKIETPITEVQTKEVVVESPKANIEQPADIEEVVVITYDPVHAEKIVEEVKQEVVVDNLCEFEEFHEHIAENTDETQESNI